MQSLKTFFVISFLLIVISIIFGLSYVRTHVENNIILALTDKNHQVIRTEFRNNVWNRYRNILLQMPCTQLDCPDNSNLIASLQKTLAPHPILHFALLNRSGEVLIASEPALMANQLVGVAGSQIFKAALAGHLQSEITSLPLVENGQQNLKQVTRSFIPISQSETGKAASLLIVYSDISNIWRNPTQLQTMIITIVVGIFLAIFIIMYISMMRFERLISKQYEANLDLVKDKAAAEAENRDKSQFLANVSHELRTPLNAIIGFSEIIKDEVMGPVNNPQYMEYIRDIHLSGVHLLSLINDILDFSKLEAGKLEVNMQQTDVTKILKNSMRLVAPSASEAKVELKTDIPKEHFILVIDAKRLKQVLLNLLSNAIKFTPEGGFVKLAVWHNVTKRQLIIEVEDSGVGIAPKDISRVMQQFGQVENKLSRKYEGTGLGLPLSKKLVELMGGNMDLTSEVGIGTKVIISMPYESGDAEKNNQDEVITTTVTIPTEKSEPAESIPILMPAPASAAPAFSTEEASSSQPAPEEHEAAIDHTNEAIVGSSWSGVADESTAEANPTPSGNNTSNNDDEKITL